jgi:hypothetical protein
MARNTMKTLLLILFGGVLSLGDRPFPLAKYNDTLDKLAAAAQNPEAREAALRSLERVAEGRPEVAKEDLLANFKGKAEDLPLEYFKDPYVRGHALSKIAEMATPEAVVYLSRLKPGGLGPDITGQLDQAIGLSYKQVLYNQETDLQRKVEFLEAALKEHTYASSDGAVKSWAKDVLCDEGRSASMPMIVDSIRARFQVQQERGEAEIHFCEARMRVVHSDIDPAKAYGTALKIIGSREDYDLISWAVGKLAALHTTEAQKELDDYAVEIDRLSKSSPEWQYLFIIRDSIRRLNAAESLR